MIYTPASIIRVDKFKMKVILKQIILRIADEISTNKKLVELNKDFSALFGTSGIALFLFNAYRYTGNSDYENTAISLLEKSIENIPTKAPISLGKGIAGIGLIVNYLMKNRYLDNSALSLRNSFESIINNKLPDYIHNFDFLLGLPGIMLFYINQENDIEKLNHLSQIYIKSLKNNSYFEKDIDGTSLISLKYHGHWYDFGIAHGVGGVILTLLKIYNRLGNILNIKELIIGYLNFVHKNKLKNQIDDDPLFPVALKDNGEIKIGHRIGWCYGDLSIGFLFVRAGIVLNHLNFYSTGLNICLQTVNRQDLNKQSIEDSSLCHGTAGIANMYNRIAQYTDRNEFNEAKAFWVNNTLYRYNNSGLDGFYYSTTIEVESKYNIISGISGIGLALLNIIDDFEDTKWDEMFLLT